MSFNWNTSKELDTRSCRGSRKRCSRTVYTSERLEAGMITNFVTWKETDGLELARCTFCNTIWSRRYGPIDIAHLAKVHNCRKVDMSVSVPAAKLPASAIPVPVGRKFRQGWKPV